MVSRKSKNTKSSLMVNLKGRIVPPSILFRTVLPSPSPSPTALYINQRNCAYKQDTPFEDKFTYFHFYPSFLPHHSSMMMVSLATQVKSDVLSFLSCFSFVVCLFVVGLCCESGIRSKTGRIQYLDDRRQHIATAERACSLCPCLGPTHEEKWDCTDRRKGQPAWYGPITCSPCLSK